MRENARSLAFATLQPVRDPVDVLSYECYRP